MLPRMPQAVIFDMDGLLIDTETRYRDSLMAAAAHVGYLMEAGDYKRMCGSSWVFIREVLLEDHGPDFPIDAFRAAWVEGAEALMRPGVPLKAGVNALLDFLDALDMPRAIATSSQHEAVQRHLGPFDLPSRFHHILARGDYAESKPSPSPYLAAAARLGIDPQHCLSLEDSHNGVRSAAAAGMMTIMVPDVIEPSDEMREKCVFIARDLHEVRDLVEAARSGNHTVLTI